MGTRWQVRLCNPRFEPLEPLRAMVQGRLDEIVAQMSPWEAQSDLSRFNAAAAGSWQALPIEFFTVLECALHWARASGGAWDPTIGPLVDLWGFGPRAAPQQPHHPVQPSAEAIASARQRVGFGRIVLDSAQRRIFQPGGLQLDLCGIAKGFAVDALTEALQQQGFTDFLVEVGGELRACGSRPDGQPWRVAVATLPDASDKTAPVLALRNQAVATSGDHWHVFEHNGQRYSHTLDPHTGAPVRQAPASVTVLHDSAMQADALATVLTVLDLPSAQAFAQAHGIAALWCMRGSQGPIFYRSPGFLD